MVAVFDVTLVLWIFDTHLFDFNIIQYLRELLCWKGNFCK